MEPQVITVNGSNQFQHGNVVLHGLVYDNRDVGKLTYDSTKPGLILDDGSKHTGLTLGMRMSPYKYETTGIYIGDPPPWSPEPDWIKPWPEVKPWPGVKPWVPSVSPPSPVNTQYVYLNPAPASPWHITTANDRITLILDIPGVKPEDINVQIENMVIKVTGKRADNGWAILHTWTLTADYDPTKTDAMMELGTLKLVVMKHVSKQTHQIKVTVK